MIYSDQRQSKESSGTTKNATGIFTKMPVAGLFLAPRLRTVSWSGDRDEHTLDYCSGCDIYCDTCW